MAVHGLMLLAAPTPPPRVVLGGPVPFELLLVADAPAPSADTRPSAIIASPSDVVIPEAVPASTAAVSGDTPGGGPPVEPRRVDAAPNALRNEGEKEHLEDQEADQRAYILALSEAALAAVEHGMLIRIKINDQGTIVDWVLAKSGGSVSGDHAAITELLAEPYTDVPPPPAGEFLWVEVVIDYREVAFLP